MRVSQQSVFISACVGILFILFASGVKMIQALPLPQQSPVTVRQHDGIPLAPDPSFYERLQPAMAATHAAASESETSSQNKDSAGTAVQNSSAGASGENKNTSRSESISARAYLVGDVKTGTIYLERNSETAMPVASMSKLVTTLVTLNTLDQDDRIAITDEAAAAPPDTSGIKAGETYTVKEIMKPLLLSSSNIAAEALAAHSDRVKFLEAMSSYAWEIGMPSTYFADPSGVSPNNKASARDLFKLAAYLYDSRPDILALTRHPEAEVASTSDHAAHHIVSTHPFVSDPRFIGGKTGRTPEAGDTMMTILDIDGHPIAFIVLGSQYEGRATDTRILADRTEALLKKEDAQSGR